MFSGLSLAEKKYDVEEKEKESKEILIIHTRCEDRVVNAIFSNIESSSLDIGSLFARSSQEAGSMDVVTADALSVRNNTGARFRDTSRCTVVDSIAT